MAFSPYRLFRNGVASLGRAARTRSGLAGYLQRFSLIITDTAGSSFLTELGVPFESLVVIPEWIIDKKTYELSSAKIAEAVCHKFKKFEILNAMSRYSDRLRVDEILTEAGHKFHNLAHLIGADLATIPGDAWIGVSQNIYPINVPLIDIGKNKEFLVMDLPARNLSLLPNGIAYLEGALLREQIDFQVLDLDLIGYHLFHMHRIFDIGGGVNIEGKNIPDDPWLAHNYDAWASLSDAENRDGTQLFTSLPTIKFFEFLVEKATLAIAEANPKIIGFSIQQCNEVMSARLITALKSHGLDSPVVVGGFSCYNYDVGLRGFPLADYMCIGESETTIGGLIRSILAGGSVKNLAGVLSKHDTPGRVFSGAPMIHDLDTIDFPKYSWSDLAAYINWDGYQLIPIIASRGCRWSRCTFCAERFYWRIRSAKNFVDELEWHVNKGHYLFMFNESDLNGMPERVLEICDEIIARGLHKKVKLTGQLRIHRKSDPAFFSKLRSAGFVALRFGVDSFSRNGMKLQQKGYTPEIVAQNLKACGEAGIFVEVNWVIGVPGEKESDIDEGIAFILENQKYIGRLANVNPLILVNGSVYWLNPSDYNIRFKEPWEDLKKKYPRAIPAGLWWSEDPFIDATVRQKWFHKVVTELYHAGFPIGDWAKQVISDVETGKDTARASGATKEAAESAVQNVEEPEAPITQQSPDVMDSCSDHFAVPPKEGEINFIEELHGYSIYSSANKFYALHNSTPIVGINLELAAIHKTSNLADIRLAIQDAVEWANTRGAYSGKKDDPDEAVMRADSNLSRRSFPPTSLTDIDTILPVGQGLFLGLDAKAVRLVGYSRQAIGHFLLRARRKLKIFKPLNSLAKRIIPAIQRILKLSPLAPDDNAVLFSKGASPELIASWDDIKTNIVRFDGFYYCVPQGISVDFTVLDDAAEKINGFVKNKNLQTLMRQLEISNSQHEAKNGKAVHGSGQNLLTSEPPKLIKSLNGFNIVEYEGFFYAIPHVIGEIDLTKVDVVEDDRIFRDVSVHAAESHALEASSPALVK